VVSRGLGDVYKRQDYELPAFVGKNSLVIGSSYSGNTEETLIALNDAKAKGATIVGITSGGKLQQFCAENNYDCIIVPGGNPPRTALAYSAVQLLAMLVKWGYVAPERLAEMTSGRDLILAHLDEIHSDAKKIAELIHEKVPVVFASAEYEGVAVRARQQFNENSKMLGWQSMIPEMNHNELVGWGGGDDRFAAIFLQTGDMSIRNQRRFDITVEMIEKRTAHSMVVHAKGATKIEKSLYLIHLVDWASLYASQLKNGDPIEIVVIDYLKNELAQIK
jgi:glucose/mannose-6-phosphate isomerase